MKTLNKEIPHVYTYVYARLKEKVGREKYVSPKVIITVLKQICRIPSVLHYPILEQMEECSLIKRINHQRYQLLKSNCISKIKSYGYDNFLR